MPVKILGAGWDISAPAICGKRNTNAGIANSEIVKTSAKRLGRIMLNSQDAAQPIRI
jgi:hypothetical protein